MALGQMCAEVRTTLRTEESTAETSGREEVELTLMMTTRNHQTMLKSG